MKSKSFETTLAIAAWITAVAALGVAIWQGFETRRHNKLSVTPKLNIDTDTSPRSDFIGISVSNRGLGPSQIKLIRLYVDGQPIADASSDGWPKVLEKLGIKDIGVDYKYIYGEAMLTAGSSMPILGMQKANYTDERISKISNALQRMGVMVCYCSLYDECSNIRYGNVTTNSCK